MHYTLLSLKRTIKTTAKQKTQPNHNGYLLTAMYKTSDPVQNHNIMFILT